jgi:hypothetical protein
MLGDLWICGASELARYARWGGLRAWEDSPDWKLLRGKDFAPPASAESPAKRRLLDPWVWLFVSHMELCRRLFRSSAELPEKRDADARKLYLDVRRFSAYIRTRTAELSSRERMRKELREDARKGTLELWLDSSKRLAEASRAVLAEAVAEGAATPEFPASGPAGELLARVKSARGAVIDPPYHAYIFLEENASEGEYRKAAQALLKEDAAVVPVVLEPSTWALLLQSSYLGAPLGWLGSGSGGGNGGGRLPAWGPGAAGSPPRNIPVLSRRLRWEISAEAASWMALWWRALWIAPGWSNRFVLYHLATRALGLRAALAGEPAVPFCELDLALAAAAKAAPADARLIARFRARLQRESDERLDSSDRSLLDPGFLPDIARLMSNLQEELARADDGRLKFDRMAPNG